MNTISIDFVITISFTSSVANVSTSISSSHVIVLSSGLYSPFAIFELAISIPYGSVSTSVTFAVPLKSSTFAVNLIS